jgi:hypothetical protein
MPAWPATRPSAPTSASSTTPSSTKAWAGQYSPHFLATIDWCLQPDPLKRPQAVSPAKVLAQRHREAPPQQKTWLEGLGSRLKTMIGRT